MLVAQSLVECLNSRVRLSNHELHLAYSALFEPIFRRFDNRPPDRLITFVRMSGNVIDPTSMPVVSDHDAAYDFLTHVQSEQHLRTVLVERETEVRMRIVLWNC